LSNGTEDKKGNALTKEAFAMLKEANGLNFVGNMEARDILSGDYDVVVSDGFNGNIALKSIEGAVGCIFNNAQSGNQSVQKSNARRAYDEGRDLKKSRQNSIITKKAAPFFSEWTRL